jgi:hypothetical protein
MTFRDFIGLGWLHFGLTIRFRGKQKGRGE